MNNLQPSKKLIPEGYYGPNNLIMTAQKNIKDGNTLEAIAYGVLAIAMIMNRRYNGFWIDPSRPTDEE